MNGTGISKPQFPRLRNLLRGLNWKLNELMSVECLTHCKREAKGRERLLFLFSFQMPPVAFPCVQSREGTLVSAEPVCPPHPPPSPQGGRRDEGQDPILHSLLYQLRQPLRFWDPGGNPLELFSPARSLTNTVALSTTPAAQMLLAQLF